MHKKLIGSIFECAFVENLSVLRGPSRIPFESFPTPWNPFADSSFALLTDPLSPLVEIFSPFPTFGGSLLSFLQPLSGPSSSFVALRGFLFLAFVDNPQLFQASPAPAPHDGADHSRVKQPVLIPIRSRGHVSLIRLAASLNIDTQDRQDKQDEKLVHKKLIGSIFRVRVCGKPQCPSWPFSDPFRVFSNPLESLRGFIFCPLNRSFVALGGNLFSLPNLWRIPLEFSPTP